VGIDENGHTVERAVEFFMPVGQHGESQQWISASMRLLSLAARGGFLERALEDMRKVAWDKGPVRLGYHVKEDGTRVPKWHDSEVSAIAFALQQMIAERAKSLREQAPVVAPAPAIQSSSSQPSSSELSVMAGKKCGECGAHAVIRKDGCDFCSNCGHMGSCG
jgi:ribonucleoside-diphosphate reductase alpha chain